jgi:hypothetical protein
MRRLPARGFTRELAIDHTDPAPPAGACAAYWIRATQEDGAQAWTSPVYLDIEFMGGSGRPPSPPGARDAPAQPWRPSTTRFVHGL